MLRKSRKLITFLLIMIVALTGAAFAQGMGGGHGGGNGGGHGGGHGGGNGNGNGGHGGQDSLSFIDLSGTVLVDSVEWGLQMDSIGGCGNWDSTFAWGHGNGNHGGNSGYQNMNHETDHSSQMYEPQRERESDDLMAVYYLDTNADGTADVVLNFGPYWYTPEDTNLTRPSDGDEITVSGALMEDSPMWDMDVLMVTTLDGADWRELGPMNGGGMMPRRMENMSVIGRHDNSPNPFNPSTTISVELLEDANLKVAIYDLRGREIKNLIHQNYSRGTYSFMWDGNSQSGLPVPSGVYIYTIQTGNNIISSQITLLK